MPFHLAAFTANVAEPVTSSLLPAVVDGWASVQDNRLIVPKQENLLSAVAFGVDLSRAQIDSEQFRATSPIDLVPIPQTEFIDNSTTYPVYPPSSKQIRPVSAVEVRIDSGATDEQATALLWFGSAPTTCAERDVYTVRVSVSAVSTQNNWVRQQLNMFPLLPFGEYQIVGAHFHSINTLAVRFKFINQLMMPGVAGTFTIEGQQPPIFRRCGLGVWGTFTQTAPPYLEMISHLAGTINGELFIDVVRMR